MLEVPPTQRSLKFNGLKVKCSSNMRDQTCATCAASVKYSESAQHDFNIFNMADAINCNQLR